MIVYMTTNLINGKKYIGSDTKNNPKYLGSGKSLLLAIKKYGKNNFKKEILEHCTNQFHLREREIHWVKYFNADSSPEFYNLAYGGQGAVKGSKAWNSGKTIDKDSDTYKKMYLNRAAGDKSYITEQWKAMHSERIKQSETFQSNHHKKIYTRKSNGTPWCTENTKRKIGESVRGRIKTAEEIQKRLETIKENGSLVGSKNSQAKSVKVTDVLSGEIKMFGCIKDVEQTLGISRFHIKRGGYKNLICEIIGA